MQPVVEQNPVGPEALDMEGASVGGGSSQ